MEEPRRSWTRGSRRRAVLAIVVVIGLGLAVYLIARADEPGGEISSSSEPSGDRAEDNDPAAGLSDSELVDQVLLLGFEGTGAEAPIVAELEQRQLGGVLVGTANWPDAGSGTALVDAIRRAGRSDDRIPPLVVTSQEGGDYRALLDLPPEETQLEIADTGSVSAGVEWSERTATALADAGLDLNLSPVADVATLDSPIADRSFSDDPQIAAEFTAAAVRGCREAGLACAAAHFPGLGAASQDTDQGPATVSLDPAALAARDLAAFRAADGEDVPAVVLSLAFYASYSPVTPGALAEPVATDLLRDEFGFDGLAITDDLGAGAVKATTTVPKAAVEALAAGADMIQIGSPADQAGVREALDAALDQGRLPRERLLEAARRVLELKRAQGLLDR